MGKTKIIKVNKDKFVKLVNKFLSKPDSELKSDLEKITKKHHILQNTLLKLKIHLKLLKELERLQWKNAILEKLEL